ncbi:MAG: SAM-dependent methyltransferase [Bacteroidales bacterium]
MQKKETGAGFSRSAAFSHLMKVHYFWIMAATLYLIPNTLGPGDHHNVIPQGILPVIHSLTVFFAENLRNARRFLISTGIPTPVDNLLFLELNRHTREEELRNYIKILLDGKDAGILSEAGMPAVADPGAGLVRMAHRKGIRVRPLCGPSSVILALAASGLNGQAFTFHGYLPISAGERAKKLKELERESEQRGITQAFMETPYRNRALFEGVLSACRPDTLLCVACDLTLESEWIRTMPVSEWGKNRPDIHKRPAIFLIYRGI